MMREKPHTPPAPCQPATGSTSGPRAWGPLWPWAVTLWTAVALGCLAGPVCGQWLLDRLPKSEPDPSRRSGQAALAVSRLLMDSQANERALEALLELWSSSPRLGANDYLYGAILAERAGHPAEARIWLALEALCRDDRGRAASLLEESGLDPTQLDRLLLGESAWLTGEPLGRRLTRALTPG